MSDAQAPLEGYTDLNAKQILALMRDLPPEQVDAIKAYEQTLPEPRKTILGYEPPVVTKGLVLTLGGAPATSHVVAGVPGHYRPDRPVPVGGPGELTLAAAQAASDDESVPLALVEIPADQVDELREQAIAERREIIGGLAAASRDQASQHEANILNDQVAATATQEA